MDARPRSSLSFRGVLSMSSFSRRSFCLSAVALAGCGFEPVYGTNGSAAGLRGSILADEPTDRRSFNFVEHFEKRMGRASMPKYTLAYTLNVSQTGLAISGSNDITRYNVIGNAAFELKDAATGQVILKDKVNSFTSYSASDQPVSTLSAEEDAEKRLMVVLGDKIVTKLLANSSLI